MPFFLINYITKKIKNQSQAFIFGDLYKKYLFFYPTATKRKAKPTHYYLISNSSTAGFALNILNFQKLPLRRNGLKRNQPQHLPYPDKAMRLYGTPKPFPLP